MLTTAKKTKLTGALKLYKKNYIDKVSAELDESGTRIMINHFLSEVLGYQQLQEIKTEYMIKGTYADYVIQIAGKKHFLVEVKSLSLKLSDAHLRQAVNYGANEGIEWAILTNGKDFELHRIIFGKPVKSAEVFHMDLSDNALTKQAVELLQYLHRDIVQKKSMDVLWNRHEALNTETVCGILLSKKIVDEIKKAVKGKYKEKFTDDEVTRALNIMMINKINPTCIKPFKTSKVQRKPTIKIEDQNSENNETLES